MSHSTTIHASSPSTTELTSASNEKQVQHKDRDWGPIAVLFHSPKRLAMKHSRPSKGSVRLKVSYHACVSCHAKQVLPSTKPPPLNLSYS